MISESVFPNPGKRWGKMLARQVLNMHRGRGKEKIALGMPTDIMPSACMKIRQESLPFIVAKCIRIVIKVSILVHVIDIGPRG